jgi:putative methionine-R-sulfoxide reductase with GAF domain
MDHYSILDQGSSHPASDLEPAGRGNDEPGTNVSAGATSSLPFPGEDGGKSLAEMAERDLNVALQLLAERAQYITGASGAAIALREGEELVCRARSGPSAPQLGTRLHMSSGLTGASVRAREILRCNDAATDPRVNQQSCRILGIASVMVMPLLRDQEVSGVFELLSDRTHAFEERDIVALQRLGEMIGTAIDHAEAGKRALKGISAPLPGPPEISAPSNQPPAEAQPSRVEALAVGKETSSESAKIEADSLPSPQATDAEKVRPKLPNIGRCQACGFPVSGSRILCLDCEAAQASREQAPGSRTEAPAFLTGIGNPPPESWLREHMYTIGIVLMVVLTGVLLLWLRPI